jgi:hypothetical protein
MSFAAAMVFALGVVSLGASTDKDAVLKEEKALWQTVKEKNYDRFRKFLTDEYRGVYGEGIHNREQEVADVKKMDLGSYSLGEMGVVFLGKDIVLVTYKVRAQEKQDGKDISGSYNCASVWKRIGTDWRIAYHTEAKSE